MWECYYCGCKNSHHWWRCDFCNAPKREPKFYGTKGYDSGYGYDYQPYLRPYFVKGGIDIDEETTQVYY